MDYKFGDYNGVKRPSISKRRNTGMSADGLVRKEFLHLASDFPLVIRPNLKGVDLVDWAEHNRENIKKHLLEQGAILFRDFNIYTVKDFERFIMSISGEALEYRFRASPRSQVEGNIYTSTDYPADQSIFPHNEHSYSPVFPLKIFFYCDIPALEGGETPIGRCRKILEHIDPEIRERFRQKKVMYVRNYGDGFGLPWQTVFQTKSKDAVDKYCRANGIGYEWKDGDRLRTLQVGPAFVKHPFTQEDIWFNHATFFHVSTLEPTIRTALLAEFKEEDLPNHTYYGDGSPIEPSTLEHLRAAYQQEMVAFTWQKADVLLLDNMLVVHARSSFRGTRRILTGMSEPISTRNSYEI